MLEGLGELPAPAAQLDLVLVLSSEGFKPSALPQQLDVLVEIPFLQHEDVVLDGVFQVAVHVLLQLGLLHQKGCLGQFPINFLQLFTLFPDHLPELSLLYGQQLSLAFKPGNRLLQLNSLSLLGIVVPPHSYHHSRHLLHLVIQLGILHRAPDLTRAHYFAGVVVPNLDTGYLMPLTRDFSRLKLFLAALLSSLPKVSLKVMLRRYILPWLMALSFIYTQQ